MAELSEHEWSRAARVIHCSGACVSVLGKCELRRTGYEKSFEHIFVLGVSRTERKMHYVVRGNKEAVTAAECVCSG